MSIMLPKEDLLTRILELVKSHLPDAKDEILRRFIQQFYAKQPLESMANIPLLTYGNSINTVLLANQKSKLYYGSQKLLEVPQIAF
jgi:hypothetical protein